MKDNLKPCPFCGGEAKIIAKQKNFLGWKCSGLKVIEWYIYIKCNKYHSRGKPIKTKPMEQNWYRTKFSNFPIGIIEEHTLAFEPYVLEAIEKWNRRANETSKDLPLCENMKSLEDCKSCNNEECKNSIKGKL